MEGKRNGLYKKREGEVLKFLGEFKTIPPTVGSNLIKVISLNPKKSIRTRQVTRTVTVLG